MDSAFHTAIDYQLLSIYSKKRRLSKANMKGILAVVVRKSYTIIVE
jgi:hypothetical protein